MTYKILIYCPDQHILYKADTPEKEGVGGGVTARIRLAQSLAGLGHDVTMISNVASAHESRGVEFLPLSECVVKQEVDVLIMTTSGDQLSLESARSLPVQARLREAWAHGTIPIRGLDDLQLDYMVLVSNFIREVALQEWGLPEGKTFVIHNGFTIFDEDGEPGDAPLARDPFSLIYTSHPSKGLDAAIAVLRLLRKRDERFQLHVYGGQALWGQEEQKHVMESGVTYHGLVGQEKVVNALRKTSFSLHLQARLEPFALSLVEAMGYGCIPIVSPVGGNREAVRHGYNGFWVAGDHQTKKVHAAAAELIYSLTQSPAFTAYIRENAQNIPWTWGSQARVWTEHWDWVLENQGALLETSALCCPNCGGAWLLTADGYHCTACGIYSPDSVLR
jgi:glycosyltransferase involved in cell wall biosynthesis